VPKRDQNDKPPPIWDDPERDALEQLLEEMLAREGVQLGDLRNYSDAALFVTLAIHKPELREPFRMAWNAENN
jgi:hypothetical protein